MIKKKRIYICTVFLWLLAAGAFGKEFFLNNKIPVYVKENRSNRLVSVYLIVEGGTALLPPEYSGLEMALFRMMRSGSKKYSYEYIQDLLYKTHADFFGFAQTEGAGLGIECLDYYLDDLLPVFADGFLNPLFDEAEYDTMKKEYAQRLQATLNSPSSLAFYTALENIYADHPYKTRASATASSIENITVENMKGLHKKTLDARRIFVVVVGNVKAKKIVKKLNSMLGSEISPLSEQKFYPPEISPVDVGGKNVVISHPAAAGTGFMYGCFDSPPIDSEDYIPACIASDMMSDVLYQVVREEHGACYTPSSFILSSKAPFGVISLYRVSDPENIVGYVEEAEKIMEEGNIIVGRNPDRSFIFEPMEAHLESYKNIYINQKYADQKTNSGVAGSIGKSLLQFGDAVSAGRLAQKAESVTYEQIMRVFKKYFLQNKRWFCVVGPEADGDVRF
ncbi:insulinase family protein [Treponema parvum]|uniref:Insulinase family protein n=1 Tax=Treponema parvum TaxID=138851 RepID=A0A975IEX5_9SPIR|nr:pitrilysin family protein [Treponema parvum]QTQ14535.1 insulinase family protein [Treponema parvum]